VPALMDLDEFRSSLDRWLDEHGSQLAPTHSSAAPLDDQMAQLSKVKRLAYDAGWMRWGWPEHVGGFGGSSLLRAYLGEALISRGLVEMNSYAMSEVLAPTMIDYAAAELAGEMVPRYLRGDETWCQGFSEPETGSNLAALACRATRTADGWRVTGQKVWTTIAQYAQRCLLLARTGSIESAHKGITALFVDMDDPGITVRPLHAIHGVADFCEVFFDDVLVPFDRMLGDEGQGWSFAMDLLPFERSTALWTRGAFLHRRLVQLLGSAPPDTVDAGSLGDIFLDLFAFRGRSRTTQRRLAAGERLGPETSVDKVLVATAEQAVFDLAVDTLADEVLLGDTGVAAEWRTEYFYSRAATIYGGTSEIQRNIIARRLLDLGAEP
jgi:alkylation response protein AidB-like acyl-CoA dehydrogenase